jgi:hypothetical protein
MLLCQENEAIAAVILAASTTLRSHGHFANSTITRKKIFASNFHITLHLHHERSISI